MAFYGEVFIGTNPRVFNRLNCRETKMDDWYITRPTQQNENDQLELGGRVALALEWEGKDSYTSKAIVARANLRMHS